MDDFEPLDPVLVRERLSKPPFVSIPGVDNVRDLGAYPTKYPGMVTKPNILYRAGEISNITEEGACDAIHHTVFTSSVGSWSFHYSQWTCLSIIMAAIPKLLQSVSLFQ